jgi:hypothetical protein
MNMHTRMFSCAAMLGAALTGLGQYRPAWAENTGLDWWNLPTLYQEMRDGEQGLIERQHRGDLVVEWAASRGRVITDLRAGKVTLAQAAARFRALDTPLEGVIHRTEVNCPGTSNERLCRQIIGWASSAEGSADAREKMRKGLEAELRRLLDEHGGAVVLPE